jgi:hypothetical protein
MKIFPKYSLPNNSFPYSFGQAGGGGGGEPPVIPTGSSSGGGGFLRRLKALSRLKILGQFALVPFVMLFLI